MVALDHRPRARARTALLRGAARRARHRSRRVCGTSSGGALRARGDSARFLRRARVGRVGGGDCRGDRARCVAAARLLQPRSTAVRAADAVDRGHARRAAADAPRPRHRPGGGDALHLRGRRTAAAGDCIDLFLPPALDFRRHDRGGGGPRAAALPRRGAAGTAELRRARGRAHRARAHRVGARHRGSRGHDRVPLSFRRIRRGGSGAARPARGHDRHRHGAAADRLRARLARRGASRSRSSTGARSARPSSGT